MDGNQIEQFKNELRENLPEIRLTKDELRENLPEIMDKLSEVFQKYGVSGAIEVEFKLNVTKLQSQLKSVDNSRGKSVLESALRVIETQKNEREIKAPKIGILDLVLNCPCRPTDPDNAPCCVVSG